MKLSPFAGCRLRCLRANQHSAPQSGQHRESLPQGSRRVATQCVVGGVKHLAIDRHHVVKAPPLQVPRGVGVSRRAAPLSAASRGRPDVLRRRPDTLRRRPGVLLGCSETWRRCSGTLRRGSGTPRRCSPTLRGRSDPLRAYRITRRAWNHSPRWSFPSPPACR